MPRFFSFSKNQIHPMSAAEVDLQQKVDDVYLASNDPVVAEIIVRQQKHASSERRKRRKDIQMALGIVAATGVCSFGLVTFVEKSIAPTPPATIDVDNCEVTLQTVSIAIPPQDIHNTERIINDVDSATQNSCDFAATEEVIIWFNSPQVTLSSTNSILTVQGPNSETTAISAPKHMVGLGAN